MFDSLAQMARGCFDGPEPDPSDPSPDALPSLQPDEDEIVGRSPALMQALRELRQVAPTDATVLLVGETGTGKELFATAVHRASHRQAGPLVKVNCAAMPANLIESELFGHERGAFTGATLRREGRFALAHGGTLFLDEIGELPLELQAKLLRVLQEREFEPVGSSRTRRVDVRVVAATNRDLAREVQAGRFREDLYFRLNVFPVRLPPLRERVADIPLLLEAFVGRLAARLGHHIAPPSPEQLRRLQAHHWPGNVRELHNVVERAVISSRGGRLDFTRALPDACSLRADECIATAAARRVLTARELERLERENYLLALESCNGRIAGDGGAAQLLGLSASTLASRLKALGLRGANAARTRPRSNAAPVPHL
jgi:transcriptional regulator with GAF, ATPase, and Fis domain